MKDTSDRATSLRGERGSGGLSITDDESAFWLMQAALRQAMNRCPDRFRESSYTFAGQSVGIRIAGRNLAEHFCQPFAHLKTDQKTSPGPALTIDLWDEEETGVLCPVASISNDLGPIWAVGGGSLISSSDNRFLRYEGRQSITWLDRKTQHIVGWTESSKDLSLYERGKPLLPLLSVWYYGRDVQIIHAGLVSRNGQGVLFPGPGGAGKSTSALACLDGGFDCLGDDYIGLQALSEGSFVGHSLYSSTWLEPQHMSRFPSLPPHAIHGTLPGEEKSLVLLSNVRPKRLARAAPIRVLALPRIVDADATRFRPASKAETLLALIPTSLFVLNPRPGARGFQRLAQLIEHVPSYWLELGRDLSEIPRRIEELLAEATR
jgi:hypothetical protein